MQFATVSPPAVPSGPVTSIFLKHAADMSGALCAIDLSVDGRLFFLAEATS